MNKHTGWFILDWCWVHESSAPDMAQRCYLATLNDMAGIETPACDIDEAEARRKGGADAER